MNSIIRINRKSAKQVSIRHRKTAKEPWRHAFAPGTTVVPLCTQRGGLFQLDLGEPNCPRCLNLINLAKTV